MKRLFDHVRGGFIALALVLASGVAIAGTALNPQAFDAFSFANGIAIGGFRIFPLATTAGLKTTTLCANYPAERCFAYVTDEDDVYVALSDSTWRSLTHGLAP